METVKEILNSNSKHFEKLLYMVVRKAITDHLVQENLQRTSDGDEFLNIRQVSSLLGIKESTLKKMNVNRVIAFEKPNKYPLYRKSAVMKYIESKHVKSRDEIMLESKKSLNNKQ